MVGAWVAVALLAYLLLPQDWMGEYRYATVAFPFSYLLLFLLSSQVTRGDNMPVVRAALLAAIGVAALIASAPFFAQRSMLFARDPPAPLDAVARAAWRYNELASALDLGNPMLLLPDLGGTLMYSRLRVRDIAGLCDREIARLYYEDVSPQEFANYVVDNLKPDLFHVHGYWAQRSGLLSNPQIKAHYIQLGAGDFVRRSSVPPGMSDERAVAVARSLREAPQMSAMQAFPRLLTQ
jgi:hypothetical protein